MSKAITVASNVNVYLKWLHIPYHFRCTFIWHSLGLGRLMIDYNIRLDSIMRYTKNNPHMFPQNSPLLSFMLAFMFHWLFFFLIYLVNMVCRTKKRFVGHFKHVKNLHFELKGTSRVHHASTPNKTAKGLWSDPYIHALTFSNKINASG